MSLPPFAQPDVKPGAPDDPAKLAGVASHSPEPWRPLPPDAVALLPMRNLVLFPHVLAPISLGRPRSLAALAHVSDPRLNAEPGGTPMELVRVAVVLQRDAQADEPSREQLFEVGTLARLVRVAPPVPNGNGGSDKGGAAPPVRHLVVQGVARIRLKELLEGWPFQVVRFEVLPDEAPALTPRAEALGLQLREQAVELLSLLPGLPAELGHALQGTRSVEQLGDVLAGLIDSEPAERQHLLEMTNLAERLAHLLALVDRRIEVLRLSQEIGARTREQLQDRERKYLLREQLNTIRKELGEDETGPREVNRLEGLIARAGMPEAVQTEARRELQRLSHLSESSSEHSLLRTWLEWLTELPWALPERPPIDLEAAQAVLEADHFGLEKVKRAIIEFLAVRRLNPHGRAPILCFVGPPGVGKTSLGQSIARALGRPFERVSLGGVHDEAEIRGHRRTYIGALPGSIIQALRRAGARDAVLMLDELDKLSPRGHGDPTAAMLEVLDPAQNQAFRDHYLSVPYDLSQVLFIGTANLIDPISPALRDRLEVIELSGYALEDKLEIARRHLLDRQREACGLKPGQCEVSQDALRALIAGYTREAGVRQLEREIGRLMRHAALQVAKGHAALLHLEAGDLERILGPVRHEAEQPLRASLTGVATGLAWTPTGGDILFVEATRVAGSGKLLLTGQLGDVMKESAQAALTLLKSQAAALRLHPAVFEAVDVHLHVPAGAVPKDGPSAGVAMFLALASLFTDRPVRHELAATGEISLRGLVLPVGGIREKVLAAQRAGLKRVMLPARNRRDLADVPEPVRQALQFVWLDTVEEALAAGLAAGPIHVGVLGATRAELPVPAEAAADLPAGAPDTALPRSKDETRSEGPGSGLRPTAQPVSPPALPPH